MLGAKEDGSTTSSWEWAKVSMLSRQEGWHPMLDGQSMEEATLDSLGVRGPMFGKRLSGEIKKEVRKGRTTMSSSRDIGAPVQKGQELEYYTLQMGETPMDIFGINIERGSGPTHVVLTIIFCNVL